MIGREDGKGVRPDLVRGIAVGRHPVRADEDRIDFARSHQRTRGHIRDQRVRNAGLFKLPGGEPGSLEVGPGLVDPDVEGSLGVMRRLDHAKRGAELAAGQGPGVAMRQYPQLAVAHVGEDGQSGVGHSAMVVGRFGDDQLGLAAHGRGHVRAARLQRVQRLEPAHHPAHRPAEVDCRRPGLDQASCRALDQRPSHVGRSIPGEPPAQGEAERRDLADRRGPADGHVPDDARAIVGALDRQLDERVRQGPLVDHEQDLVRFEAERGSKTGRIGDSGRPSRAVRGRG